MTTQTLNEQQLAAARRQAMLARISKTARRAIVYGLMTLLGFLFLFPIVFMVVAAFKPNERVIADLASIRAFFPEPSQLTLDNIRDVFARVNFERLAFNSLFITLVTVVSGLFVNSMAAFVLSRLRWPGRTVMLSLIVSLIIIPLEAIAVPLLMQVNQMGAALNIIVTVLLLLLTGLLWAIAWNIVGKMLRERKLFSDLPEPVGAAG